MVTKLVRLLNQLPKARRYWTLRGIWAIVAVATVLLPTFRPVRADLVMSQSETAGDADAPFVARNFVSLRVLMASVQLIEESMEGIQAGSSPLLFPLPSGPETATTQLVAVELPTGGPPAQPPATGFLLDTASAGSASSPSPNGESTATRRPIPASVSGRRRLLASQQAQLSQLADLSDRTTALSKRSVLASVAAIPEPSALWLVLSGWLGYLAVGRIRNRGN